MIASKFKSSHITTGEWYRQGQSLIHKSAIVEDGAVLKGPIIIGPDCLVAAHTYLRGGIWLQKNCVIGPSCELKTSFMFEGAKVAHLSFVGDSIIGTNVNIESGATIANFRNELADKEIIIRHGAKIIKTGVSKFGALIGDNARIGANAVIAPGALIDADSKTPRLALVDQRPE